MEGVAQWAFFKLIFDFLDGEIEAFRENLLGETLQWVSGAALLLLTLWILVQGYRIATGQSRDSMMGLATSSLRSVLIVGIASSLAFGGSDLYRMFSSGLPKEISHLVTGADDAPEELIDKSLTKMQWAMIGIDALAATGDQGLKEDKDRAMLLTGVGIAGPSVVGGAMLLMYKVALALFVGLAPLFVLSLLFEQTKPLFGRWLYYGIGTMFSLGVLSFMVTVAMKMVLAVATTFAAQYLIAMSMGMSAEGVNSMAMQQGGMGLILTVLLVMIPPMAASFFQGTLGQFAAYSAFGTLQSGGRGGNGGMDSAGRAPGAYGYTPQPVHTDRADGVNGSNPRPERHYNQSLTGTNSRANASQKDVIKKDSTLRESLK